MSEKEKVVKLNEQRDRGEHAKRLLEDPLFVEACKKVRDDIFEEFELTKWNDRDRREFLDKELRAFKRVLTYLKGWMLTGEEARKELVRLKDPSRIRRMMSG